MMPHPERNSDFKNINGYFVYKKYLINHKIDNLLGTNIAYKSTKQ